MKEIFNEDVLETRIDETIPLEVSDTQLGFMRVVANTFVDNINVSDEHRAKEIRILELEIDGKSRNLNDPILEEKDEIYQQGLIAMLLMTYDILADCIDILGFDAPGRM